MSVPEQTPFIEYTANGTTTVFPVPFQCDKAEYLIVKVNDLIQLLGTWSFIDGSVVFNTAPLNESIVTIQRSTKLSRTTDYSLYDNSFRPEPVNYDFDNIWRVLQEVAYQFTIAENKFQDLIDQLVEGNINGLPAEILARIAGDEANGQLISQEIARAFFAEQELGQSITDTQIDLNNKVNEERNRAIGVEQSLQLQITTGNAGIKYFSTEAELLAFVPTASDPKQAYAFDTKKNYLWKLKSGSTTEYEWKDEGVSQLDQANIYTDQITGQVTKLIAEESGDKILIVRDSQGKPVFFITTSGRFYIPGLDNDVATKINALDFTRLINFDSGGNIFEVRDVNGSVSLRQLANGDLLLPKLGNLTNVIEELRSGNADASNSINYLHRSARYTDYALADTSKPLLTYDYLLKASDVNAAAVFPHVVSYLRIPAITRIQKDKYLLFFEARADISDFSEISQGVATVTIDITTNVASVSNIKSLHNAFTEAGVLWTFMNACAVKIDSGRIICLYVQRNGTTQHKLLKRYSDDDGVTWSDFEDISSIYTSKGWNLLCPCSQGVLKRFGVNKGRIVFPTWTSGPAYNSSEFRAGYVYSDDGGQTFQLGAFANYTFASEVQCAEDLNGDLLFSVRIESQANPKIILKLKDGLDTYDQITPNVTLTAASVMSGLIQGDNRYDGSAAKFQLTACKNLNRTGLLIHTSYDGGLTWKTYEHPTVSSLAVAYTCIENLTPSKKFVLWESNVTRDFSYSIIGIKNLVEV